MAGAAEAPAGRTESPPTASKTMTVCRRMPIPGPPTLSRRGGRRAAGLTSLLSLIHACLHPSRHDEDRPAGLGGGMRGLPRDRRHVGAPADLHGMRPRRMLRLLAEPARVQARRGE